MTPRQIAALKYLIFKAKIPKRHRGSLVKRLLAFLIEKSEGLTKEVCVTLWEGKEGFKKSEITLINRAMKVMKSCTCGIHLYELMELSGSGFCFSDHYGHIENGKLNHTGIFPGKEMEGGGVEPDNMPLRGTFWLSKKEYSDNAETIPVTRKKLDTVNITKSGLYDLVE